MVDLSRSPAVVPPRDEWALAASRKRTSATAPHGPRTRRARLPSIQRTTRAWVCRCMPQVRSGPTDQSLMSFQTTYRGHVHRCRYQTPSRPGRTVPRSRRNPPLPLTSRVPRTLRRRERAARGGRSNGGVRPPLGPWWSIGRDAMHELRFMQWQGSRWLRYRRCPGSATRGPLQGRALTVPCGRLLGRSSSITRRIHPLMARHRASPTTSIINTNTG